MISSWLALLGLFPALLYAETVVPPPASSGVPHPGIEAPAPAPGTPPAGAAQPSADAPPNPATPEKDVEAGPARPDPNRVIPAQISREARDRAKALALYAEALRIESESRDPAAALPTFLEIVELDPKFIKAHLQVAYYHFRLRQNQQALEHLQKALETNPDSGDLKSAASRACYLLGRHEEAEQLARDVITSEPTNTSAYRALVDIFAREERPDAINELLQDAIKRDEGDSEFYMKLAETFRRGFVSAGVSNQTELAKYLQPIYRQAEKKGEKSQRLYTVLAECAAKLDDNATAIKYAKLAIKQEPDDDVLFRRLAAYLVADGNFKEALKAARKAWDLSPYEEATWQLLVKLYLKLDEQQKAVDVLMKVIEIAPQNGGAYRQLAALYAEMENPEKAADTLIAASRRFPNNTELTLLCSMLLRDQKRYGDGIKLLELAIRGNPTHPRLYLSLADLHELSRDWKNAEVNYRQALSLDDRGPLVHTGLARVQAQQGNLEAAAETLAKARQTHPTSAEIAIQEAVIARLRKRYNEALTSLAKFETLVRQDPTARLPEGFFLEKGVTYELLKKWDESEQALQDGLAAHPNGPRAHLIQNALAYQWAERDRNLKEALELSKASLEKEPKNGAYLDTLGWIYFKMGDYKKSLQPLQNAALATENDPVVLDHLAQAYLKLGRKDKAIEIWQQLLKDDPEDEDLPDNDEIRERLRELGVKVISK